MSTATGFNSSGALGTVKSVGLTMPDAFTVDNSPITESGVIEVTLEGTASQYVRGDGQLAQLPTISGGGGGQVFYLNGGTSQGTIGGSDFEQLSPAATIGTEVDFTSTTADLQEFVNFITDVGTPDQETVPAGSWIFQCYFSATAPTAQIYATVEVWNGASFSSLGASLAQTLSSGATTDLYTFTVAIPEYDPLAPADRIAVRFYAQNLLGVNTVTLHTQNSYLGSIQTTFTTGLSALNGLTKPAQYLSAGTAGTDFAISSATDTHTFNLPTASATNRGALSSADWTTFNGKQNALGYTAEDVANKSTTLNTDRTSDIKYPSVKSVYDWATSLFVRQARSISTTSPLTGGGTLSSDLTLSIPAATASVNGYLSSTDWTTFNGKADYAPRVQSVTSSATVTPTSLNDLVKITAQAAGLTIANPTGTMSEGQALMIRIKDNGTAQTIAFGTNYRAIGVTLPTTTTISKTIYLGCIWNDTDTKFDVLGVNIQA